MDVRMKFKNPITWPRKWLKIDKQVQQNLCFWCSRLELYGRDVVLPRPCMWGRSQASFKCNKYSTNKRKKSFTGALERNPGVEEKEKKARCLWWSIQANQIKCQNTMYFLSERVIMNTNILKGSDIGRMGGRRDLFQGKAGNSKGSLSFSFNTKVSWFFWVVNSIHFHLIKFSISIETCSLSFSCNTKVGWSFSVVNSNYFPPIKFRVVGIFNLRTLVASSNPLSLCHPRLVFCVQICFLFFKQIQGWYFVRRNACELKTRCNCGSLSLGKQVIKT